MESERLSARFAAFHQPAVVLAALLAFGAGSASYRHWRATNAIDFFQFWAVGQVYSALPDGEFYSAAGRRAVGDHFVHVALEPGASEGLRYSANHRQVFATYSTPLLYALFGALSSGDYDLDYALYHALSLLALAAAVLGLCTLFGYGALASLLALAFVLALNEPYRADIRVGNVNALQVAGLALLFFALSRPQSRRRDVATGALLALLVLFKPNLAACALLLGFIWLARGKLETLRWNLLGAAGAALVAVAGTSALMGARVWPAWLAALRGLGAAGEEPLTLAQGNYAPARLLFETTGLHLGLAFALALGGACLAILWLSRRKAVAVPDALAVTLGAGLATLAGGLSWLHYFLLPLPGALYLLRPSAPGAGLQSRQPLAALALLAFTLPWSHLAAAWQPVAVSLQLVAGALCLMAAAFSQALAAERATD